MDSSEVVASDSRAQARARAGAGPRVTVPALAATLIALQLSPFAAGVARAASAASVGEPWPGLRAALAGALSVPGTTARVEVLRVTMPTRACGVGWDAPEARFEVSHPVEGSGRVAVKVIVGGPTAVVGGARAGVATASATTEKTNVTRQSTPRVACTGWLWADVRVMGPTPVARRSIRAGEPVDPGAVRLEEREIRAGQAPAVLGADAVADRLIAVGQVIEPSAVRTAGPRNGEALKVVLVSGGLQVEQLGHALACGRGQCAVLPSGKHVEGTLVEGRLMVTVP